MAPGRQCPGYAPRRVRGSKSALRGMPIPAVLASRQPRKTRSPCPREEARAERPPNYEPRYREKKTSYHDHSTVRPTALARRRQRPPRPEPQPRSPRPPCRRRVRSTQSAGAPQERAGRDEARGIRHALAGDRPARSYDEPPARSNSDRPARSYDDRPRPSGMTVRLVRPVTVARSYGDRPARSNSDRPARSV